MNVNKNTRAGRNGKCIQCPHCGYKVIVYHFAWSASVCGSRVGSFGCDRAVEKNEWVVVG